MGRQDGQLVTNKFTFLELVSGSGEVVLNVQALDEINDGVAIGQDIVLDDLYEVLEGGTLLLVGDDSGSDVANDVRAHSLYGVQVTAVVI